MITSVVVALLVGEPRLGPPIVSAQTSTAENTISRDEQRKGWKLLFDGKSTAGWHNFSATGVKPGWQIVDGTLKCADPSNAGDLATDKQFKWFELNIDFKVEKGQNSGVMFHVASKGNAPWHSGPEIQIIDNDIPDAVQKCGFLYDLIPSTKSPAHAAGTWNTFRIVVSPSKCYTELNGIRMYEYMLGSEDFMAKIKKSKFSVYPGFGTLGTGSIAVQGDHGVVAFKNIKLREIKG